MNRTLSIAVATSALVLTPACAQERVDTADKAAIEQVVHDYILEHPEIIEEALIKLTERQQVEEQEQAAEMILANMDAIYENDGDYSVGPEDAPVTVVEFFDYRCGYCKSTTAWATTLPAKYDDQVRVIFKEMPILSAESEKAAFAALAAGKQGKYLEMHLGLMALDNKTGFGPEEIDRVAEEAGVDVTLMRADMKSIQIQKHVADTKSLARTLLISGTPNFMVGTVQINRADPDAVESLIDAEIQKLS